MDGYIITKREIDAMQGADKTHFLNPNARRTNKSLGDATGLTGLGVHLIEISPGRESTEYHVHYYEDECVYILSGEGEVTIGEETFAVSEGDFIGYRAGGRPHTMKNTGDGPLRCLVAGQRLAHDMADYPRAGKRLFRNAGRPWNLVDLDDVTDPKAGK